MVPSPSLFLSRSSWFGLVLCSGMSIVGCFELKTTEEEKEEGSEEDGGKDDSNDDCEPILGIPQDCPDEAEGEGEAEGEDAEECDE